ncbi:MAG TPA: LamG domain-containing protein [Candidatus Paceibacterota bacterium]
MRIEQYTLPLVYLIVFLGVFGFHTIIGTTPQQQVTERVETKRPSPFGDPTSEVAAAVGSTAHDLVAYWPFDEHEGVTLPDQSVWGNTGLLKGNPQWVNGKEGGALSLDGIDDYVLVDNSESLNLSSAFSVSVWVRSQDSTHGTILSKNGLNETGQGGYKLSINNHAVTYSVDGMASLGSPTALFKPNEWTYILVSYDKARSPRTQLYVNGQRILSGTILAPEQNSRELLIGRDTNGGFFKGSIDELRIYNRALSDGEVGVLYHVYVSPRDSVASKKTDSVLGTMLSSFVANVVKGWHGIFYSK